MTKKISKVIAILLIVMIAFSFVTPVFAANAKAKDDIKDIDLVDKVSTEINTETELADKAGQVGGQVIGVIQVIGTVVAIVMLVYLGIKYVVAAPDEKADIKKSAFIYVIAAIFIFAASNILAVIETFAGHLINNTV